MSDMKDTVTYPLSAVMGDDEDRIDQLERELVEAREQLRLCNVDQFTTAAELAEAVAKERERCARVCEERGSFNSMYAHHILTGAAAAIRKGE
jgi:hypothetical protein